MKVTLIRLDTNTNAIGSPWDSDDSVIREGSLSSEEADVLGG